jgi:predicted CXXCH cytochrome family protein
MKYRSLFWLSFLLLIYFQSYSASASPTSPHSEATGSVNISFCIGGSLEQPSYGCHDLHDAPEPELVNPINTKLLKDEYEKDVCYSCHNQTGGANNVKAEFGNELGSKISAHNIFISPEDGGLLCSSCHTSHMQAEDGQAPTGAYEVVVLLRVQVGEIWKYLIAAWNNLWEDTWDHKKLANPADFCGGCHGSPTSAFGDHVSNFTNSVHNGANFPNPPTRGFDGNVNSNIKCDVCHQPHGSDNPKLLSTNIKGKTVSWNDNSVCYACHTDEPTSAFGAYRGQQIYERTKHFTATTSNVALITTGASYEAGYCLNCHDPHGTQYSDFRREDRNEQCYVCHNADYVLTGGYSFRGETSYTESAHGSTDSNTIWPSSSYTGDAIGGGGGATAGECINCHDPMGRALGGSTKPYDFMLMKWSVDTDSEEQELCFKCHSVGFNYDQDVDRFYGMTNSNTTNIYNNFNLAPREDTSTSGAKVNNSHDIDESDQTYSGAKVECGNCHNTHINNRLYAFSTDKSRIADPDDITKNFTEAYAKDAKFANGKFFYKDSNDLTASFDVSMPNFVNYCLKCHDGNASAGVIGATVPFNISTSYAAASGADAHGRGDGTGADLEYPYAGNNPGESGTTANAYSAMNCNDCHDSHGTINLYNLKSSIYINGVEMIPSGGVSTVTDSYYGGRDGWCTSCHASLPSSPDHNLSAYANCGSCHYHGSNF